MVSPCPPAPGRLRYAHHDLVQGDETATVTAQLDMNTGNLNLNSGSITAGTVKVGAVTMLPNLYGTSASIGS
jgi:hypothetical protein